MEPSSLTDEGVDTALVTRRFTTPDVDPYDTVEWSRRDARAGDYFQANVEAPVGWTDGSIGVVAKLYFATVDGVKEDSVRQMVHRVVWKIMQEGLAQGHFGFEDGQSRERSTGDPLITDFAPDDPARVFYEELVYICLHQLAGFNTPTWCNLGVPSQAQCGHACYPLSVEDTMVEDGGAEGRGITNWWAKEALIFKSAGGSGINVSNIRGSMEPLSSGGVASGPLAYMRASNAGAETLKSGGKHRRAAKFVCMNDDHPDLLDFIECKVREDDHMRALAAAGINMNQFTPEGERNIAETTSFQSANHSVCVTDDFMDRATGGSRHPRTWSLLARVSGDIVDTIDAPDTLRKIAEAAWRCADPGLIFIDTINKWHTTPSLGPITTTNTCGEVTQNDDTACNLSALNVLKFIDFTSDPENGDGAISYDLKLDDFRHVVDVMATAMDIVCGFSELPTELITQNTRDLRQLGMGFTNLGAAIMAQGLPYDSDEGRDFAASITALLTGRVYSHSAKMAKQLGAFKHFEANAEPMLRVIAEHRTHLGDDKTGPVWYAAGIEWHNAQVMGEQVGYRNALATAMMPTGTVSFLLGASPEGSTGIEPVVALTTEKSLAAAGKMTLVNTSARLAGRALGYTDEEVAKFAEGDWLVCDDKDRAVFATALGSNSIAPMGHVRMVAAIQPFVSQAISKTVNVPEAATVEDMLEVYTEAWRSGVKVLSVYRDNSKSTQVLKAVEKQAVPVAFRVLSEEEGAETEFGVIKEVLAGDGHPQAADEPQERTPSLDDEIREQVDPRNRMPRTRSSITHKIHVRGSVVEHEGYVHAGVYPDGRLGELFIEGFGKQGSFTQNALSAWATAFSIALQYGVPMEVLCRKHAYVSDETGGIVVPDPAGEPLVLRECKSIVDYIARWLVAKFADVELQEELGVMTQAVKDKKAALLDAQYATGGVISEPISVGVDWGGGEEATLMPLGHMRRSDGSLFPIASMELNGLSIKSNGHATTPQAGPPCPVCSTSLQRTGACWTCICGFNTGCA